MKGYEELVKRREELEKLRSSLCAYLDDVVLERQDWHGVMDAAADLREVDAKLEEVAWVLE